MTNQKPSQMLRKAWALIDAQEKWTHGSYAKTKDGTICNEDDVNAACFCSIGALFKLGSYSNSDDYLRKTMGYDIIKFNDTHTWEEVKAAWMKAIQLAEEDEAKNDRVPQAALDVLSEIKKNMADVEIGLNEIKKNIESMGGK